MNLLFLSTEFPTPWDPHLAVFNRSMIVGLAERHHVDVVCPVPWTDAIRRRPAPETTPSAAAYSVSFPRFYFPPRVARHLRGTWLWWSVRRALRSLVARRRPDAVLSYWAHPDGEAALRLARQLGVPAVLMVGGSDVLLLTDDVRRRQRVEAVLRGVDAVVAIGGALRERVVAMGVSPARVTSIMRPVSDWFTPGDRAAARRRCALPADHAVVLWVGRLVPVKAVDVLIQAVALLRDAHPTLLVCIAGDGPEGPALVDLARRLGVDSAIRWLGAVPHGDLPDWYRAADLTVLPSRSEGVPNVLLESIACGTPFVASRIGSIPEIADEVRDCLVTPGQPGELATAIDAVLRQGASAGVRARGPATAAEFQARLDAILGQCVAAPRPAAAGSGLRSATVVRPRRWRQALRSVLVNAVPRRWLVAAGRAESRAVCLTFDDGPDVSVTASLLDVLKRHDVRATFFVRGDRASASPTLLRRIVDEGHLLGHHSWSHSAPHETSARRLLAEVRRTRDWLRAELGTDVTWFRPPHGKVSVAKACGLWATGLTIALWNVDPGDVYRTQAGELVDWFSANPLRPGDVVLLHDTSAVTVEALPALIAMVRQAGLDLTTLDRFGGRSAHA